MLFRWVIKYAFCGCALFVFSMTVSGQTQNQKQESAPFIVLDGPNESPEVRYVQKVLEKAYETLGYRVAYQPLSLAKSVIEVNSGRIDGLRARIGDVEKSFPNLVKIPEPLLNFEMVLIADRRACGACDLKWVKQVAVVKGFRAFEDYRAQLGFPLDVVYVTHPQQAFDMVVEGKVAGAIMSNTNVPKDYYSMNHHWIKSILTTLPDYHYVHRRHIKLVPELSKLFSKYKASGELTRLQKEMGVKQTAVLDDNINFGKITAATASWAGYSDTPDGTYFKVLKAVYSSLSNTVDIDIVNWKRAKKNFYDGKVDILVGAYDFEVGDNGVRSDVHLDYEMPVTAYAKDAATLNGLLSQNKPGTACYLLGYALKEVLPKSVSSYESPTIDNCVRLLGSGRVDMLLDYEIDLPKAFVNQYAKQQVLEGFPLFLIFQNTERGNQSKQVFEVRLRELLGSGKLKTLFPNSKEFEAANFVPINLKEL